MCPFCHIRYADLRRHIEQSTLHKNEPKLKAMSAMSTKQRHEAFSAFRKEGILEANKQNLSKNTNVHLECERRSEGRKVKCSKCNGIYTEKYFWKHRQNCTAEYVVAAAVSANEKNTELTDDKEKQWISVIERMKRDEYRQLILDNPTIITIGKSIYYPKHSKDHPKHSKEREARHKCIEAMRRLARLHKLTMLKGEAIQLFNIDNYAKLETAIYTLCDGYKKHALRVAFGILLKTACKILIAHLARHHQPDILQQVKTFQNMLTAKTQYSRLFGMVAYQQGEKTKSQTETTKLKNLPNNDNYETLWRYLDKEAEDIIKNGITTRKEFIHGRRVFHAMSTLLNGKRGNAASHTTMTDWLDRNRWLTSEHLHDGDEDVTSKYAVTFIMCKANRLVPMFFQNKISQGLDMMCDRKLRKMAGVTPLNNYLFPYTEYSANSCIGYIELDAVCKEIGIPRKTATPNRHRASTSTWNMELEDERIIQFLNQIDHDILADTELYTCPPAAKEPQTVAPTFEKSNAVCLFHSFLLSTVYFVVPFYLTTCSLWSAMHELNLLLNLPVYK